ncbi:retina-specific copper amine oxidase isoform X3 [Polypterus senegalus]|uniref:retina-specific copper amine oxidase isoform X3 n=1 Tax=Polypterus senegalus TaxID=55291 RepID=UPI001966C0DE|nr:retina-specific copper amine oxidase isoform X3 [Polypterus senegalus]
MDKVVKLGISILLIASLIANLVLICVKLREPVEVKQLVQCPKTQWPPYRHDNSSLLFADLTGQEHSTVKDYLQKQNDLDLNVVIFLIELHLPKKLEVLRYLNGSSTRPFREARVYLFSEAQQKIMELVVGPLPNPTYHRDVSEENYGRLLPFNARVATMQDYKRFEAVSRRELAKAPRLMRESFGHQMPDLKYLFGVPAGAASGDRLMWMAFSRQCQGYYLHPVGLEVLLNYSDANSSNWHIQKAFYNGQYFDSIEELSESYEVGNVTKISYQQSDNYASLRPRSKPTGVPPLQVEPNGKRYSVRLNQVFYLDWRFAFGLSSLTGMRIFDVRFKQERIAYEVSVQEAIVVYGSNTPASMIMKYTDSTYGIGNYAYELVRGVDCPYFATYVDTYRHFDTNHTQRFRNSICIFEHNEGRPLRRHVTDNYSPNYGGAPNSVLVMRTISAIGNYDYIWDFVFYQNGALEVKVFATGYISSAYLTEGGLQYGHQVAANTLGTIHTHFLSFKADLDIEGTNNYFLTKDMAYHEVQIPWSPERRVQVPKLVEKQLKTENEAALRFDQKIPRYLHIASNKTNKWGHNRSYRIQVLSFNGDHLPESVPEEAAVSWARYKVAITKHKDHESTSSSLYNQNDMWSPAVNFSSYINGESIENEDLVAWISTGFLHIPHAEDIPNTVTAGNGGGFFLRPHNYFDEDPSINSPDSVYLDPSIPSDSCELNPNACLQKEACMPNLPAFTYNGFDEVIQI